MQNLSLSISQTILKKPQNYQDSQQFYIESNKLLVTIAHTLCISDFELFMYTSTVLGYTAILSNKKLSIQICSGMSDDEPIILLGYLQNLVGSPNRRFTIERAT